MSIRSGESITKTFTLRRFDTGAASNADSLPTGTLYVNGTADAATVTVTNISTGKYKAAVTLPTLAAGDLAELMISATVNSVSDNAVIWWDSKDLALDASYRPGIDWSNVGAPTTTLNLSGTLISSSQVVASVTGNVGGNVNGNVAGNVLGSVALVGANAITAASFDPTGTGAISDAVWDEPRAGHTIADSFGEWFAFIDPTNLGMVATDYGGGTFTIATVTGNVIGSVGSVLATGQRPKRAAALADFDFPMFLTSNGTTLATGATVTAQLRKDNGSYVNATNQPAEIGTTGTYKISSLTAAEMTADKVTVLLTAGGCVPQLYTIFTEG